MNNSHQYSNSPRCKTGAVSFTPSFFIGVDIVAVARCIPWLDYPHDRLSGLYTAYECAAYKERKQELNHSKIPSEHKDRILAQFLASRFAAKEALYKALSQWLQAHGMTHRSFSFKALAPLVSLEKEGEWQLPVLHVDWEQVMTLVGDTLPPLHTQVSIAHEHELAIAQVLLQGGN